MANNEVKIKLTADGSQVQNTLKMIDQQAKNIGLGNNKTNNTSANNTSKQHDSYTPVQRDTYDPNKTKQDSRDKVNRNLLNELTLIRKELQKGKTSDGRGLGPSSVYSGSNSSNPYSSAYTTISPNTQSNSGSGNDSTNNLSKALSKLFTAGAIAAGATKAYSYIKSGAESTHEGEMLAHDTYGSTLWYNDYYKAKKDAYDVGSKYGVDYSEVLTAGQQNIKLTGVAGQTKAEQLSNYSSDIQGIIQGASGLNVDSSLLSQATGRMTKQGVSSVGDQTKLTKIISGAIVSSGMVGREEEMINVLNGLSDDLYTKSSTVTQEMLGNQYGLYTALQSADPNLKGEKGAEAVQSITSLMQSDNEEIYNLANIGSGGQFTGIQGRYKYKQLQEKNPTELAGYVLKGSSSMGYSDDMLRLSLSEMGLNTDTIEAMIASKNDIINGTYNGNLFSKANEQQGEQYMGDRNQNWLNSNTLTKERYDLSKQNAKETAGSVWNDVVAPFQDIYSSLPAGGQIAVDAAGAGIAMYGGKKALTYGSNQLAKIFKGGSSGATGTASQVASNGARVAESATEATSGASKASKASKLLKGSSKLAKGAIIVDAGISTYNVAKDLSEGDNRAAASDAGSGVGGIAGGIAGAKAGAALGTLVGPVGTIVGGILGGVIGGVGGSLLGEKGGESIYDAATDKQEFSQEEQVTLKAMYNEVSKLYKEHGNDAAQDYTLNTVNPYLESLGVSKSIRENYETDVGKPDFMEDIENGVFGDLSNVNVENTEATSENTEALNEFMTLPKDIQNSTDAIEGLDQTIRSWSIENGDYNPASDETFHDTDFYGVDPSILEEDGTSHAVGNPYVPYDNYKALLHKGEMVLTAYEADEVRRGKKGNGASFNGGSIDLNINISGNIEGMTTSNQEQVIQAIVSQINSSNKLQGLLSNGFQRLPNY